MIKLTEELREAIDANLAPNHELFNTMREAVVFMDIEGHLIEVNPAFCRLVGYTREELLTMKYHDFTPEKWLPVNVEMTKHITAKEVPTESYEKEYVHKDGHIVPIHVQTWPMFNPEGIAVGMREIIIDLSEMKTAEQVLAVTDRLDVLATHIDIAAKALEESLSKVEHFAVSQKINGVALDAYIDEKEK